jgi:hypothetical protein
MADYKQVVELQTASTWLLHGSPEVHLQRRTSDATEEYDGATWTSWW